jgi:molybdopterin-guanine dinucleotide biosynthesis protein A
LKLVHVEGAILAGGASSRMGRDKTTLEWDGVPLVERVARALSACMERVRVVVRPGQAAPSGLEPIEDAHEVRAPIVGLAAALGACESAAVLVAACDLPYLDPRVLLALLALVPADGGADVVLPVGPRGPEPLVAVWRPRVLPEIERRIARGAFALREAVDAVHALRVEEAELRALDPELRFLFNANHPGDLPGAAPQSSR